MISVTHLLAIFTERYGGYQRQDTYLVLPLALGTLQPQHQLLGGLCLLPQDGLGLTSESLLLTVVSVNNNS